MGGSSKEAEKSAKKAQRAAEQEAALLKEQTEKEKAKQEKERKKAGNILARSQRARGGGSYESNPTSTKLG